MFGSRFQSAPEIKEADPFVQDLDQLKLDALQNLESVLEKEIQFSGEKKEVLINQVTGQLGDDLLKISKDIQAKREQMKGVHSRLSPTQEKLLLDEAKTRIQTRLQLHVLRATAGGGIESIQEGRSLVKSAERLATMPPHLQAIHLKLMKKEKLNSAEWKEVVNVITQIENQPNKEQKAQAMEFCEAVKLSGEETELMPVLLDQTKDPKKMLLALVLSGMVSQAAAEKAVADRMAKGVPAAEQVALTEALTELKGKKFQGIKNMREWAEKKAHEEAVKRSFGHKNIMGELLSGKGIIATYVAAGLASTLFINLLMNPKEFFTNPGVLLPVGVGLAGAELTGGLWGLFPKPSVLAQKALDHL